MRLLDQHVTLVSAHFDCPVCDGKQHIPHDIRSAGGNARLVGALADGLNIEYNSIVDRVQCAGNGVKVHAGGRVYDGDLSPLKCPGGSCRNTPDGSQISAVPDRCSGAEDTVAQTGDAVLVTAPVGVLKKGTITFDPPLPPHKQAAISRMGFGLLNKVARRSTPQLKRVTNLRHSLVLSTRL